ncbi:MAG: phosphohydrolase, partial [Prevotella pallens]
SNSFEEKIVALLHDTVEDGGIAAEYLLMLGFPQNIVNTVLAVSRREGEDYFDFIQLCKENPIGRVVKICDLEDNMDITRLNELTEKDIN